MAENAAPLRGKELARAVINKILQEPGCWNQRNWHECKTVHCFGGWCQVLGGLPMSNNVPETVPALLGIKKNEAEWLFESKRSLHDLWQWVKDFISDSPNRDGYDRDGYDRDGYDRDGFDRDGYNRVGYNRAGYDRAGYNRAGYDRDGERLPLL